MAGKLHLAAIRDPASLSFQEPAGLHEMLAEVWPEYHLDKQPRGFVAEMSKLMEDTLVEYLYWKENS